MSLVELEGAQVISCSKCRTHVGHLEDVVSKTFHGRDGRAYLIQHLVNVKFGREENRVLLTGLHTVCDVKCSNCQTTMGWKYLAAFQPAQRYKVGKFVVETKRVLLEN